MGLGYAKGLRKQSAEALVTSRMECGPFQSAENLALRVPSLNRNELTLLARIGALNKLATKAHRRDALWQVDRAGKMEGPLLRQSSEWLVEEARTLPLQQMTTEERLVSYYAGTGLTVGKHPMHYRRQELRRHRVLSALELKVYKDGEFVRTAGCVIARQRPGTAKGFIFLSMEDETGIANVIVTPDLYERDRLTVTRSKFLLVTRKRRPSFGESLRCMRAAPAKRESEICCRKVAFHLKAVTKNLTSVQIFVRDQEALASFLGAED